jgi:hypothetical protein
MFDHSDVCLEFIPDFDWDEVALSKDYEQLSSHMPKTRVVDGKQMFGCIEMPWTFVIAKKGW